MEHSNFQKEEIEVMAQGSVSFHFLGENIQISETAQEYNRIISEFSDLSREKSEAFEKWYKDAGSLDIVLKGLENKGDKLLVEAVEYVVNRVIEEGVYTYNLERFMEEYLDNNTFRIWYEASGVFLDGCAEQLCNAEQIKAYREQRKNSRSKFVGGGFGVSGAIKGSISAGALNMVTGTAHSLVNIFGNAITDMQLAEKRKQVYKNPASIAGLSEALGEAVYNLYSCYLRILVRETGKDYTYITEKDRQTSKAITDNCMSGRIQGEAAKKAVTEAVSRWYYNEDAYRFAIGIFGDKDNAIQEMGEYFGRNIYAIKKEFLKKSIEQSNLKMTLYKDVQEPMTVEELTKLKEEMQAVFAHYGVPYSPEFHEQLEKLEDMLKTKSWGRKYVAGKFFDDVETADLAKKEIEKIYALAMEKDLPEEELYLRLKELPLEREEIKNEAEALFIARRKLLQGDAEEFADQVSQYTLQNCYSDNVFKEYHLKYVRCNKKLLESEREYCEKSNERSSGQMIDEHLRICLGFARDEKMALVISKWEMKTAVKSGIVLTNKKIYIMEHGKEEFSLPLAKLAGVKMSLAAYSVYSIDGSVKVYKLFGEVDSLAITKYMNKAWENILSLVGLLTGSGVGSGEDADTALPAELTEPLRQWISQQGLDHYTKDMSICIYGSDSFAKEQDEIYRVFQNTFVGETVLFANLYFDNPFEGAVAVTNKKFYFRKDKKMGESIPIGDILNIRAKGLWTKVLFETTKGELIYKNYPTYFCGNEEQFVQMLLQALQLARKVAEQGNAKAKDNLGKSYEDGNGAAENEAEVCERYRKAAEQGDVVAQYNLGICYEDGRGVTQDYGEAYKWYRKAAEQGDIDAQYKVGECYQCGYGVAEDEENAYKWYRKAADQECVDAQLMVGACYYDGYGVAEDKKEAYKWYRKAAEQGNEYAQHVVGECYYYGEGVTEDTEEAYKWYKKAAEQGFADAQYALGGCYDEGIGVTENAEEAYKWYRKAAEQGFADAQHALGVCYMFGDGVAKDKEEARKWWRKAAEQGNTNAQCFLGQFEQDYVEAFKWYRKAAEQGDAIAQYKVGQCYDEGRGVEQNQEEAYKWYKKAAEQGYEKAQKCADLLKEQVRKVELQ